MGESLSDSDSSLSRRPFLAGVGALALGVIAGCGTDDSEAQSGSGTSGTTTITVGVIPIVDVAPVYLGIQQGVLRRQG
jgi:NitT/TauT family transport system substrate-binding protein